MSTPERIWAWEDDVNGFAEKWWGTSHLCGGTKYVRADIAADLLAALEAVVSAYENGGMIEPINQAIAAIAKAKAKGGAK